MAAPPKYGKVPRRRDDLLSVRVPRHVPDQVVRGMNRHIKCFSIKRQKIRDNIVWSHRPLSPSICVTTSVFQELPQRGVNSPPGEVTGSQNSTLAEQVLTSWSSALSKLAHYKVAFYIVYYSSWCSASTPGSLGAYNPRKFRKHTTSP